MIHVLWENLYGLRLMASGTWKLRDSQATSSTKANLLAARPANPLITPTTDLDLSIRLSMVELRETGDWDISRARGKRRGFIT